MPLRYLQGMTNCYHTGLQLSVLQLYVLASPFLLHAAYIPVVPQAGRYIIIRLMCAM